ncbi:MAG: aminopeptidase [Clostridia bacterium]|nr:aminopeptidase [Clostridia bacterium]
MEKQTLTEYASLLVKFGLGDVRDREVLIHSSVETYEFARLCVSAAYEAGAAEVTVLYGDDFVSRSHFLKAHDRFIDSTAVWKKRLYNDYAKAGVPTLFLLASDPMNLEGVLPERLLRNAKAKAKDFAPLYRLEPAAFFPWCIAALPVVPWAKRVFPDLPEDKALSRLWAAVLETMRITGDGKSGERWKAHLETLKERTGKLNAFHFTSLHYTNSLGTDLTVKLPPNHVWQSGEDKTPDGRVFVANMPTEEIFTAPLKTGTDGIVYASKPLVHNGNLIKDFYFVLKKGKITEVHAKEGEEILKNATEVDGGACYLGEVALIPYDSPISKQNILYYETLFDENASCHLAFGEAYPCVEGGMKMSPGELKKQGLNHSAQHVDFMIGTKDLSIVGTDREGKEIRIFKNGNFCI